MLRRLVIVFTAAATTACATASRGTRPAMIGAGRDVLTATEIVASRVSDLYQAIVQLRPEFLRRRNPSMMPGGDSLADVYLDDQPLGGTDQLRRIPLDRVRLIRYIDQNEADLRYGGSHPAGAILVTTLR